MKWKITIFAAAVLVTVLGATLYSVMPHYDVPSEWQETKVLKDRSAIEGWKNRYKPSVIGEHRDMVDLKGFDLWTIDTSSGYLQLIVYYDETNKIESSHINYTGKSTGFFNESIEMER